MSIHRSELVAQEEYAPLLTGAFEGINYAEAEIPRKYVEGPLRTVGVEKRSRSEFDTEQGAWWKLEDTHNTIEAAGRFATGRVVILEKQYSAGIVRLRLGTPGEEHRVLVDKSDHELPTDFSPGEEFLKGLRFLAGGNQA